MAKNEEVKGVDLPTIHVKLEALTNVRNKPIVRVNGEALLELNVDNPDILVKQVKDMQKGIEERKDRDHLEEVYVVDDVYAVLNIPEFERDEEGKRKKNKDGNVIPKPLDIRDQRKISRLVDSMEAQIIEVGEDVTIEFDHRYDDVLYLCRRMIENMGEYPVPSWHVSLVYDYFSELETEADDVRKKHESGGDETADDSEKKTEASKDGSAKKGKTAVKK